MIPVKIVAYNLYLPKKRHELWRRRNTLFDFFLRKSKIGESLKQLDTRSNEANFLLPIELAVRAI
jgi:hypothetical protein